jgi:hypothetical protein
MATNEIYVDRYSELWKHTIMRIKNAEADATVNGEINMEKFQTLMIKRLKLIRNEDKIHYAITALKENGYTKVAEIYDTMLMINALKR